MSCSLTEFLAETRKRDLLAEFEIHYKVHNAEDPESWPLDLTPGEWFETFSDFVLYLKEKT
jgi:hypothetical protein